MSGTPFFSVLTESIHRAARNRHYNLAVTYIDEKQDDIEAVIDAVNESTPAGAFLSAKPHPSIKA